MVAPVFALKVGVIGWLLTAAAMEQAIGGATANACTQQVYVTGGGRFGWQVWLAGLVGWLVKWNAATSGGRGEGLMGISAACDGIFSALASANGGRLQGLSRPCRL